MSTQGFTVYKLRFRGKEFVSVHLPCQRCLLTHARRSISGKSVP